MEGTEDDIDTKIKRTSRSERKRIRVEGEKRGLTALDGGRWCQGERVERIRGRRGKRIEQIEREEWLAAGRRGGRGEGGREKERKKTGRQKGKK